MTSETIRVLLVDDDYPREELNEPLGIEVLAAALRNAFPRDLEVKTLCCHLGERDFRELAGSYAPHVIGISSKIGSVHALDEAVAISVVRNRNSFRPLFVLGGMLPTLAADEVLDRYPDIFCVVGEGEEALIGLVEVCMDIRQITPEAVGIACLQREVPNLVFRHAGGPTRTPRSVVQGTEEYLRPHREFSQAIVERHGLVRVEASRGCPWSNCDFCVVPWKYNNTGWRPFALSKVLDELMELSAVGAETVYFTDEEFIGTDVSRIRELCRGILELKRKCRINPHQVYYASTSVRAVLGKDTSDGVAGVDVFGDMKEAGFLGFFIGIESGSDEQLSRYNKGVTVEENRTALRLMQKSGFETDIGFIMFDPEARLSDLQQNLDFIKSVQLIDHQSRFGKNLRLVPHTRMTERCMAKGLLADTLDLTAVEYAWSFADAKVQAVHRVYSSWEQSVLPLAFHLQATMRGTSPSEAQRQHVKEMLGQLRRIDYQFLAACVAEAGRSTSNLADRLHGLYACFLNELQRERRTYDD